MVDADESAELAQLRSVLGSFRKHFEDISTEHPQLSREEVATGLLLHFFKQGEEAPSAQGQVAGPAEAEALRQRAWKLGVSAACEVWGVSLDPEVFFDRFGTVQAQGPKELMAESLAKLLAQARPGYVVFRERSSRKFVQFEYQPGWPGRFVLDLPAKGLDEAELRRAAELFCELGSEGPREVPVKEGPTGRPAIHVGFELALQPNSEGAAEIGMRVFAEVFGFSRSLSLVATRGWQESPGE